jgi:hypothetical protein
MTRISLFVFSILLSLSVTDRAYADFIFVAGAPHINMITEDDFLVTAVGGRTIAVGVPIAPNMTSGAKAALIASAMRTAGISTATSIGNRVFAVGYTIRAFIHSNEKDRVAQSGEGTAVVSIGLTGPINGKDISGTPSLFEFELGSDDFDAVADVTFSVGATIGTILMDAFDILKEELPPNLRADIGLDLVDQFITFDVTDAGTNPFVGGQSTDSQAAQTFGVVSEPASLPLVLVGLIAMTAVNAKKAIRRHREAR